MSIYLFTPAPVAPSGANVKVFTDSGCTSLATITSVDGLPIPGSVIPSDGQTGALPHFLGPQTSLWLKVQTTGGATVALTATDSGPAAGPAGAYVTVVEHGATAGTARPAGAVRVFWRGSVAPTNAVQYDRWINSGVTPYTESIYDGSAWVALGTVTPTLQTKTANYTMTTADTSIIANGTSITIMLPSAVTAGATAKVYWVKNINSTPMTLGATAGTIDGATTATLQQNVSYSVVSDGTNWLVV